MKPKKSLSNTHDDDDPDDGIRNDDHDDGGHGGGHDDHDGGDHDDELMNGDAHELDPGLQFQVHLFSPEL